MGFLQHFYSLAFSVIVFWKQTKGSHEEADVTAFCSEIRTVSLGTEGARGKGVIHSALGGALCLQDTGKISSG